MAAVECSACAAAWALRARRYVALMPRPSTDQPVSGLSPGSRAPTARRAVIEVCRGDDGWFAFTAAVFSAAKRWRRAAAIPGVFTPFAIESKTAIRTPASRKLERRPAAERSASFSRLKLSAGNARRKSRSSPRRRLMHLRASCTPSSDAASSAATAASICSAAMRAKPAAIDSRRLKRNAMRRIRRCRPQRTQ